MGEEAILRARKRWYTARTLPHTQAPAPAPATASASALAMALAHALETRSPNPTANTPAQPRPDRSWCWGCNVGECVCEQAEDVSCPFAFLLPCTSLLCVASFGTWSSWYSRSICGTLFPFFVILFIV